LTRTSPSSASSARPTRGRRTAHTRVRGSAFHRLLCACWASHLSALLSAGALAAWMLPLPIMWASRTLTASATMAAAQRCVHCGCWPGSSMLAAGCQKGWNQFHGLLLWARVIQARRSWCRMHASRLFVTGSCLSLNGLVRILLLVACWLPGGATGTACGVQLPGATQDVAVVAQAYLSCAGIMLASYFIEYGTLGVLHGIICC